MRHAWLLWITLLAIIVAVTFEISARGNPRVAAARPRIFAFLLLYALIVFATPLLLHSLDEPFDYAATAAAPPVRLGVFGAWTATRTARVEGQRFNCQADAGPLDPAPPGAHPWARARLAVYVFPGAKGRSTVAFWVRRVLPPGTPAVLEVGNERVVLDRGGGGPVRLAQNSAALLALLERTAEVEPDAVVTVTAPTGPGEAAAAAERFSLSGFRDARDAAKRECTRPVNEADSLVLDGGLVRFGTGWNVHAVPTGEPGRRTCFAAARQLVSRSWPSSGPLPDPVPDPAGPRLVVARREASQGVPLLAYDPGHAYADGAEAVLQVGEQRFRMPVRGGMAEARESAAAVQAMLGADPAGTVTVTGPGDGGTEVVSRFSLDGFRWTYDAAATYCNEPS